MSSLNIAIIAGNIGRDAETKYNQTGTCKTEFSVATSEKWTDKASGEKKEKTVWHNVVVWQREKLAQYLVKGARVTVHGKIDNRTWEKDGVKYYRSEIIADEIVLMGGGQNSGGGAGASSGGSDWGSWSNTKPAAAQAQQQPAATAVADDDEFNIF